MILHSNRHRFCFQPCLSIRTYDRDVTRCSVLLLVSQADTLANGTCMASHAEFRSAYEHTLPAIDALEQLPYNEAHVEACMDALRQGLASMEQSTSKMMNMLYEVDVYMTPSSVQNAAGFNPQEALTHVSDLFHVGSACRHSHSQSYQAELLAKRETLADYTCEDISLPEFTTQWRTLEAVQQGQQQGMDDLADLLAKFG